MAASPPIADLPLQHIRLGVERLTRDVGSYLLHGFRADAQVRLKGAIDLVTQYDEGAEEKLKAGLETLRKELGVRWRVVGEESGSSDAGPTDGTGLHDEPPVWYVDPIDGTTNFAHGHPFFCISMGLYSGAREPLVAVVHAPALGVTWASARGHGATRDGASIGVSSRATLDEALCATGFPYDRRETQDDNLREHRTLLKRTRGVRRCGSAALDLSMVADGTYDIYWEQRLSPWDMAAGAALVLEAGGRLSDYDGGLGDPLSGRIVASNGLLHDAVVALLGRARSGLA